LKKDIKENLYFRVVEKNIYVAFISKKTKELFETLRFGRFEEKRLYDFIKRAIEDLKKDPFCGIKISKKLWSREYVLKFKISNLWKYNLPNGWRLIYTIESDEIKIINIILEWFDHKSYEKRFNY
jgi:Txe/YoeB family toxin of Txe-Axe toxin-antitoxin module